MPSKSRRFATLSDVRDALTGLPATDLLRLKRIAQIRSAGLVAMDWRDLINEAIKRILSETRRWPLEVPFIAFVAQTMRSIASEEWNRFDERAMVRESDLITNIKDEDPTTLDDFAEDPITPEREASARNMLQEIEAIFAEDPHALAILHGLANGQSPGEIQSQENLTKIQYSSIQKRMRRALTRKFDKEIKSHGA